MTEIIEVLSKYGVVVVLSGILACAICGAIKVPVARMIRGKEYGEKAASDKVRNFCTLAAAALSVLFVGLWYGVVDGYEAFYGSKVYAEMLGAFTASKVVYMLYEGFDKASLKKLIHSIIANLRERKVSQREMVGVDGAVIDYVETVQTVLIEELKLPLTEEQRLVLVERLKK